MVTSSCDSGSTCGRHLHERPSAATVDCDAGLSDVRGDPSCIRISAVQFSFICFNFVLPQPFATLR